jgi:NAD(P)-dependent dehydrogenase (short-subunit alcohol dehydrogenase family)
MDLQLTGKRALITGSTLGIGYAIAEALAAEGARVWLNGRGGQRLDDAVARLRQRLPEAGVEGVAADVATAEGCATLIGQVPDVDILVNNAGIFQPKPFFDIPDEDWEFFYALNVMSGVRLSRHYLRGMLGRNWGRVLFISSESGINIPEEMVHYGMTKTAQLSIARGLAEHTRGTNVTVNSILPGPTASEGVEAFFASVAEQKGEDPEAFMKKAVPQMRPSSLIQRFATPEEVATTTAYFASPLASATNGAALRVDGGVVKTCF